MATIEALLKATGIPNLDVILMVVVVVTLVIGLVLFGTYYLNRALDRSAG
jgi:hypothetical protein